MPGDLTFYGSFAPELGDEIAQHATVNYPAEHVLRAGILASFQQHDI
jgi:hypothetical protein